MIKELKSKIDPEEGLAFFDIDLGINSKNLANCPFCLGKYKLKVNIDYMYCYKCGYTGDFLDIICKLKNLELKDVIYKLSIKYGINTFVYNDTGILEDLWLQWSSKPLSEQARHYLASRGLDGVECVECNQLDLPTNIKTKLKDLGIVSSSGYPLFSNRIIFPIRTWSGSLVHLSGRSINDSDLRWLSTKTEFKPITHYLYQSEYYVSSTPLFICEGITDTLSLRKLGLNALGTFGVSCDLTIHIKYLKTAKSITFCYDNDRYTDVKNNDYKSWSSMLPKIVALSMMVPEVPMYVLIPPERDNIKDVNDWVLDHKYNITDWSAEAKQLRVPLESFCLDYYYSKENRTELLKFLLRRKSQNTLHRLNNMIMEDYQNWWDYFDE